MFHASKWYLESKTKTGSFGPRPPPQKKTLDPVDTEAPESHLYGRESESFHDGTFADSNKCIPSKLKYGRAYILHGPIVWNSTCQYKILHQVHLLDLHKLLKFLSCWWNPCRGWKGFLMECFSLTYIEQPRMYHIVPRDLRDDIWGDNTGDFSSLCEECQLMPIYNWEKGFSSCREKSKLFINFFLISSPHHVFCLDWNKPFLLHWLQCCLLNLWPLASAKKAHNCSFILYQ